MALGIAAWMHYLRGVDELGQPYLIDDPHAADLTALYQRSLGQGASLEAVQTMLSYTPVFGDLAGHAPLAAALLGALQSLQTRGVLATLVAVNREELGQ
jgi:fructuronate reductase